MKKLLASLMLIVVSVVGAQNVNSLDPTQVYSTGNLTTFNQNGSTTTSAWQNVGQWGGQITCWAPGDPGYCGPQPFVNTNGNINFSYGLTDLHQIVNIANALPNTGTGLRVNGFVFGFQAKNGNGWDNGQQDYLAAYVKFYGSDGKVVQNYDYSPYTNKQYNWNYFSFNETFATPYANKDLSTAQYGFVGYDTNFWAGPYGPEINSVSFSLKYSVDPCYISVLSSPSCPGYMDALQKLITPPTTATVDPITTTSSAPLTTTTTTVDPITSAVTTTSSTTVGQTTTVAPVVSTSSTTSTTTTQASKESNKESTANTNLALSVISKNKERDKEALSVSQTAVSQANQAAQQSQQEANNIAATAVANSVSANIVSVGGQQANGTGIRVNNTANSTSVLSSNSMNNTVATVTVLQPQVQNTQITAPISIIQIEQQQQQSQIVLQNNNTFNQSTETYSIIPPNFLTDKSNPLNDIVEGKQQIPQNNTIATVGPSVNKNVSDNEVAGGVDLNKIAVSPNGYGNYLNLVLRDVAFYAPKEVYRNQRNVDNARALRSLTNDSKHQEMVEQQYRR